MEDANEYVRFLSRKENLRVALRIEDHLDAVKDRLHRRFWKLVEEHVKEKVAGEGLDSRWSVQPREGHSLTDGFGGVRIVPSDHKERGLSVVPNIEQKPYRSSQKPYKKFQVIYGLWAYPHKGRTEDRFRAIDKKLRADFADYGFKTDDMNGAPVQCLTDCYARSRETLISVADEAQNGTPGVAYDMAERFFELFRTHRSTIERMNAQLSD